MTYYIKLEEDTAFLLWDSRRGTIMKNLREVKGISRAEMARRLAHIDNASQRFIVKLEMGKGKEAAKTIESKLFIEICKILEVSPRSFGYGELIQPKDLIS